MFNKWNNKVKWSLALALVLALVITSLAFADNVTNDVVVGGNDTFTAGGSTTINYKIVGTGGDGQPGCNASDGSSATVTINVPAGVTVTPGFLTFTTCNVFKNVEFSSSTPGNYSITVSVSDSGAGTYHTTPAEFTLHVLAASDTTPPVITPNISGTLGDNDWYVSNVTVSWSVVDDESAISSTTGCDSTTINTETTGTTLTCSATSAGGTSSKSVTIKLDKTGPSAALAVTAGTPGANGWYTSDVTVSTSGSDDISSPVTCTADQYQTDETDGTVFNGSCTNDAGLTTNADPLTVKLDMTGPSATLAVTAGTPGANGWYTSDVTVSTSGTDSISSPVSCTPDQYQTTETAGAVFNGSCTNDAGLTTNAALLTVKLDKTGPSASLSAIGNLGNGGWYISNVTIKTTGSDTISDPTICTADQFQTTDTASATFYGSCTNNAGLSTDAAPLTIKRDATPPSITWNGGPADGGSYYFGFVPTEPTCTASDALSGPDGCTVSGHGTTVGSHTMTATAYDKAGNSTVETRAYTVLAWTLSGFYHPVDKIPAVNTVKGGSTVPLKFEAFAGSMELTDTTIVSTLVKQVTCLAGPEDTIEVLATGGTSLRYDWTADQFIFNWQTPKLPGKCYTVTMTTQDGSYLEAFFKLK